jgi:seryl-tRNA synthetase
MLDVKFIRENPELVQSDAAKKGYDISIKDLLKGCKGVSIKLIDNLIKLKKEFNKNTFFLILKLI